MSSATLTEQIATPVAPDNPVGSDPRRKGGPYQTIRDARMNAAKIERSILGGTLDTEEKSEATAWAESRQQWKIVKEQGQKTLAESKDLEIACYVVEALARLDDFGALAQAFAGMKQLIENFWDGLYPRPRHDDDDLEQKTGIGDNERREAFLAELLRGGFQPLPDFEDGAERAEKIRLVYVKARIVPMERLTGIGGDESFSRALLRIPVTENKPAGVFSVRDYRFALEDPASLQKFEQAVKETRKEFFEKLVKDIESCQLEYDALTKALTDACEKDSPDEPLAPSTSAVRDALAECRDTVRTQIAKHIFGAEPAPVSPNPVIDGPVVPAAQGGPLRTRSDAFNALEEVAKFFERTEPLSLFPAQLRKLISQAQMDPAEYFSEIIEDKSVLEKVLKAHGLKKPSGSGDK